MKKAIVALARRLAVIMLDSLKVLDPRRPIREADIPSGERHDDRADL